MARTRASKPESSAAASAEQTPASPPASKSKHVLGPSSPSNPPHVWVLPEQATRESRIVTLPNPRTSQPARYLVCPETGVYEFTRIAAPKAAPSSWLITPNPPGENDDDETTTQATMASSGDLFVATPFDPLFLMLPALAAVSEPSRRDDHPMKRLFLSSEDHLDALPTLASHLRGVLQMPKVKTLLEARIKAACDVVDAGDDQMYRLNEEKLLAVLLAKARRLARDGLPASMEERFVKKALEAPLLAQRRIMTVVVVADAAEASTTTTPAHESVPAAGAATDADTLTVAMTASDEVVSLQRLRVAFDFICVRYVPPTLARTLQDRMLADAAVLGVDFAPLTAYATALSKARADALAARAVGDYSVKRGRDDDEAGDARAEKKRRAEEEKKKKNLASRGVKDLKKVDTSGMKKLSAFFTKKTANT